MLGIRSTETPRWVRLAFAVGAAVGGCVLLSLQANRLGDPSSWYGFMIAGLLCGIVGYYGSTWEREG